MHRGKLAYAQLAIPSISVSVRKKKFKGSYMSSAVDRILCENLDQ